MPIEVGPDILSLSFGKPPLKKVVIFKAKPSIFVDLSGFFSKIYFIICPQIFQKNSGTQSVPELNDEINLMTLPL